MELVVFKYRVIILTKQVRLIIDRASSRNIKQATVLQVQAYLEFTKKSDIY